MNLTLDELIMVVGVLQLFVAVIFGLITWRIQKVQKQILKSQYKLAMFDKRFSLFNELRKKAGIEEIPTESCYFLENNKDYLVLNAFLVNKLDDFLFLFNEDIYKKMKTFHSYVQKSKDEQNQQKREKTIKAAYYFMKDGIFPAIKESMRIE